MIIRLQQSQTENPQSAENSTFTTTFGYTRRVKQATINGFFEWAVAGKLRNNG